MEFVESKDKYTLNYKDKTVFEGTRQTPFITALQLDIDYQRKEGKNTANFNVIRSIPLSALEVVSQTEQQTILKLSAEDIVVTLTITEKDNYLSIIPQTDKMEGLCFNFLGYEQEGIFGGGLNHFAKNLADETIIYFANDCNKNPTQTPRRRQISDSESSCPMMSFFSSEKYAITARSIGFAYAKFDGAQNNSLCFSICPKELIYITQPSYKQISSILYSYSTTVSNLPEWTTNGIIAEVAGGATNVCKRVLSAINKGVRISGIVLNDWSGITTFKQYGTPSNNYEVEQKLYPDFKSFCKTINSMGIKVITDLPPFVNVNSKVFRYCKQMGYLVTDECGETYIVIKNGISVALFDLTNPKAVNFVKQELIIENLLDFGIRGFIADGGEILPVDCCLYEGDPIVLHNEWSIMWAKLIREVIEEKNLCDDLFFIGSAGGNGIQGYVPVISCGELICDYSKACGLASSVYSEINLGLSGIPLTDSGIGGKLESVKPCLTADLLIRWAEIKAFTPIMRFVLSDNLSTLTFDSKEVISTISKLSGIHDTLKPYFDFCLQQAKTGIPIIRAPFYNTDSYSLDNDDYSFFVGDDIFIVPVLKKHCHKQKVIIPQGEWIHIFSGTEYSYSENKIIIDAPLGTPAVFYRKNSTFATLFEQLKSF